MGNKQSNIIDNNDAMNEDVKITGDLNIYVCGNINTFLNCENGFNYIASRNYYILEQIFDKMNKTKSGNIQLNNGCEMYYQYEFRGKEIDNKKYNAFLFFNKADEEFLDMLFDHLLEVDNTNKNKNVVIFFGEDDEVIKCIDKLNDKSMETVPFLIIISNKEYEQKLKYINYIPDLNTLSTNLNKKEKLSEDELSKLAETTLINYINYKLLRIDMFYNQVGYDSKKLNPKKDYLRNKAIITIALLGYSGCGKSTLINIIFNELVSKTSNSSIDLTTRCSEYYFPIKQKDNLETYNIRFLDFPGITEAKNYKNIVEPELIKKLKEYKEDKENIDIALFFIENSNKREFTDTGLELINFLHNKKIKIIFIINGDINELRLKSKKDKIRNILSNKDVLNKDLSNLLHTNFSQSFTEIKKEGVSEIFKKIFEIAKINEEKFDLEDFNIK